MAIVAVHEDALMIAIVVAPGPLRPAMPILTATTVAPAVMTIPSDERRAALMLINKPAR
jgi:hypothetical protein